MRVSGRGLKLSENFTLSEFRSCDGADTVIVHPKLVEALQKIRDHIQGPLNISAGGGYRTWECHAGIYHRNNLGPAPKDSYHLKGMAADVSSPAASVETIAWYARNVLGLGGVAMYKGKRFVHLDVGPTRSWADGVPERGPIGIGNIASAGGGISAGALLVAGAGILYFMLK